MVTVGKIRDAHGLRGELFVVLFAKEASWSEDVQTIRLLRKEKVEGSKENKMREVSHDFPVKRFKMHKRGMILKVEGISDRTEAEAFRGALFQIPNESLSSKPGEKIYLGEIMDFVVSDETLGELGPVAGFSTNGAQDLLNVETSKGKFEIPLVPDFIVNLDFKKKTIQMKLPEGLVEK